MCEWTREADRWMDGLVHVVEIVVANGLPAMRFVYPDNLQSEENTKWQKVVPKRTHD